MTSALSSTPRVLIVQDEESLADPLATLLRGEGYRTAVANDGPTALSVFDRSGADIVLLDLMLPGMGGHDVCKQLRARSSVPVIMLTTRDSEIDKVVGLELGADDYVTKPYSARELIARIRAVLRRRAVIDDPGSDEGGVLEVGSVRMDVGRHMVWVNGVPITLPLKEFDLLEYLMRNSGRVLTRGQLIDRAWGSNYYGDTKTLDVHVNRLRAKIEDDPANPVHLLTVRGLGYKLGRTPTRHAQPRRARTSSAPARAKAMIDTRGFSSSRLGAIRPHRTLARSTPAQAFPTGSSPSPTAPQSHRTAGYAPTKATPPALSPSGTTAAGVIALGYSSRRQPATFCARDKTPST